MIRGQLLDLAWLGHFSACHIIPSATSEGKWWLVFKRKVEGESQYEVLESDWVLAYAGKNPVRSEEEFDSEEEAERAAREFALPIHHGF